MTGHFPMMKSVRRQVGEQMMSYFPVSHRKRVSRLQVRTFSVLVKMDLSIWSFFL